MWPEQLPLLARISATDWVEGGWSEDESVELARRLRAAGVDLVLLARQMLRDPYWPLRAATRLGQEGPWPRQYLRAK